MKQNCIKSIACCIGSILLLHAASFAQMQLEFDVNSYPTAPSGPSIAPVTATFRLNTTGTTFTNYTLGGQPVSVTASWSNQQFTNAVGISTKTGSSFGTTLNNSDKTAISLPVWNYFGSVSAPTNAMFTSNPFGAKGTGIDITTNYGFNCFTTVEPLYSAGTGTYPLNGRFYYSDLTLTFSRPVSNPVFQVSGLGGTTGGFGFSTEFDLATPGITLARISGSNVFKVNATQILNNAGSITANSAPSGTTLPDGTGNGAASGSVRMTGNNITTIKFRVYLRGDGHGSNNNWSNNNTFSGDRWLLGFSMNQPALTGNVFHDTNGLLGTPFNTVDGTGTNLGGLLYINIVDANGNVAQSVPVSADGTFAFQDMLPSAYPATYTAVLSTTQGVPGNPAPAAALPSGWLNTGEFIGAGAGNDGTVNGISSNITFGSAATVVDNINFGIELPPTANNVSGTFLNPVGTTTVQVPTLNGADPEEGVFSGSGTDDTVKINTLPLSGTLYYNGTAVTAGTIINNYNPALLTFDPPTGNGTYTFTYSEVDGAGVSSVPATATLNFTTISISGGVFHDSNGLNDNVVNGPGTNAGGLNAVLIDASTGKVAAVTTVASNGNYSFPTADVGNYTMEITTNTAVVGNTPPAVALPSGWVSTGEHFGTGPGSDGTPNGVINLGVINSTATKINFGLEMLPVSDNKSYSIAQPVLNSIITLNAAAVAPGPMSGSDTEDGILGTAGTVVFTLVPSNSQLYYNGVLVANNTTITNYNPSLLQLKFTSLSAVSTFFRYKFSDAAGNLSLNPATYTIFWNTVLPVTLTSFDASKVSIGVLLSWAVEGEINTSKYLIEHSSDNGLTWQTIGITDAAQSSSLVQNYFFTDVHASAGTNLYRLKLLDLDGTYKYSAIKNIEVSKAMSLLVYPNPAKAGNPLKLILSGFSKGQYLVNIVSASGQLVHTGNIVVTNESAFIFFLENINFPEGNYTINVRNGTVSKTAKLIFL
jgi:hypothetical protein